MPLVERVDYYTSRLKFYNDKLKVSKANEKEGLTMVIEELASALLAATKTEMKGFEVMSCRHMRG